MVVIDIVHKFDSSVSHMLKSLLGSSYCARIMMGVKCSLFPVHLISHHLFKYMYITEVVR